MSEQEQDDEAGADPEAEDGRVGDGDDDPSPDSASEEERTANARNDPLANGADLEEMLSDVVDADADVTAGDVDSLDTTLVDRIAESDAESVARELASLRMRVEALESHLETREDEVEELESKLVRKQADFQNYKKRMEKRREEEKRRATEDLVERLLDVRDNLVRALDQEDAAAEDIRDGVETTLSQFDRVLAEENVEVVEPEPGEAVDPHVHEVLMRVDSAQPVDTIADIHRPGYRMAEKVLRPAQVTVSDGAESDDAGSADGDDSTTDGESVADDAGAEETDGETTDTNDGE